MTQSTSQELYIYIIIYIKITTSQELYNILQFMDDIQYRGSTGVRPRERAPTMHIPLASGCERSS